MWLAAESAWATTDTTRRAEALAALALHLPEPLLTDALPATRKTVSGRAGWRGSALGDENRRAEALAALAPHLRSRSCLRR